MNYLKILITVSLVLIMSSTAHADRKCGACHGAGKVQTKFALATYGVRATKEQCPRCKQTILSSEPHWDPCTTCGGTGYISGRSGKSKDEYVPPEGYDIRSFLTPAELSLYEYYKELLSTPYYEYDKCTPCGGTGICHICKGVGIVTLESPGCRVCSGSGHCIGCRGLGYTNKRLAKAPYEDDVRSQMQGLLLEAAQRMHKETGR